MLCGSMALVSSTSVGVYIFYFCEMSLSQSQINHVHNRFCQKANIFDHIPKDMSRRIRSDNMSRKFAEHAPNFDTQMALFVLISYVLPDVSCKSKEVSCGRTIQFTNKREKCHNTHMIQVKNCLSLFNNLKNTQKATN